MRPGKPLIAGTIGETVLLGLPGNPSSAFVTATLFLLPLVRHLAGARDPLPAIHQAPLATALDGGGGRVWYETMWWCVRVAARPAPGGNRRPPPPQAPPPPPSACRPPALSPARPTAPPGVVGPAACHAVARRLQLGGGGRAGRKCAPLFARRFCVG